MLQRLLPAVALMAGLALVLSVNAADDKSIELFNGKDTTGWKWVPNGKGNTKADDKKTWSVKDKVLICTGEPWGYLITEKDHGDYVLEFEWKWANTDKEAKLRRNSGVLLHCEGEGKPWPNCFEAQLLSGNAGDIYLMGLKLEGNEKQKNPKNANHIMRLKTEKELEKPLGEWNKYEITCKGDTVSLTVNGQKVNDAKKIARTKGKIALQSEGAEIHFRNIKLTPVK